MQICIGCGKKAPETETNYTLISAQFGWRLTRQKREDGEISLEWRCPTCWREFKRARTGPGAPRGSKSSPPEPGTDAGRARLHPSPSDAPPSRPADAGSSDASPAPRRPGRSTR